MSPARKRDTTDGFDPGIPLEPSTTRPCFHALRLDGELASGTLSPALHRLLLDMARIRNVVSTLRIEGADVDLEDARRILAEPESLVPREQQVQRFASRYAWIHETPRHDLPDPSVDLICELHGELFQGDPELDEDHVGSLKGEENVIRDRTTGAVRFHPTPPDRTLGELESLIDWYGRTWDTHPPGIVAAFFFAEFQAIHPFVDGNGRLGRLLTSMILKQMGHEEVGLVPLDARFHETRDRYYEKLASTNDGETWVVWTRYFVDQLEAAYRTAVQRTDLEPVLEDQETESTRHVLEWVLRGTGEWFARADYPNPEGYHESTVRTALRRLVDQDILETQGEKKGRRYRLRTEFLEDVYEGMSLVPSPGSGRTHRRRR